MIVKVCGMGDKEKMQQLAKLNIDLLGFIFYPKSPRYVVGKIEPKSIANLPKIIRKTGVFVNAPKDEILEYSKTYHLDTLQLHGTETVELCRELKAEGFSILKTFNLNKENDYEAYSPYCDYFLFDTPSVKHGGTGQKFDWELLNNYSGNTPFLLSGGIGSNDAETVKQINNPQFAGVDINSKFEVEPGVKDVEKVKRFLESLP